MENVKIECRCKHCNYSEKRKDDDIYYCWFWDYNAGDGEEPNIVHGNDFCSNGEKMIKE